MIAPPFQDDKSLRAAPANPLPPLWGRMETLWLLVAPLCALLYTLCLPLAPNDLWYHVRAGELIARGAIPTQNLMSSAIALDAPYYYQSWLAELVLFVTLKIGGLSGLVLVRSFFVAGAFLAVTAATFRALLRLPDPPTRLVAARISALGAILGLLMASNNLDLRPQVFSLFGFGVWIFAALEFRAAPPRNRARWGAFLAVWIWVWANTHGAFIVALLGLFALALSDRLWRRENFKTSLGVAIAAGAAALLNPRGAALYGYVAGLSRDEVSQKWVQEWRSPGFDEWHSILFWACAAGIFLAAIVSRMFLRRQIPQKMKGKANAKEFLALLLPLALFFSMAARDQRSIVWFALWLVPVLGALCCGFIRGKPAPVLPVAPVPRAALGINATLLVLLGLSPLALFPGFKAGWPWPKEFKQRFAPTPSSFAADPALLLENTTPVAATQFLLKNPPRGKLWTDMVCGSYLTYAGRGEIRPWCDPRIEMFPVEFWEDYLKLSGGPRDAVAQMEARGFSDVLLDRENTPALARRFRESAGWRRVAANGSTLLFRRDSRFRCDSRFRRDSRFRATTKNRAATKND